MPSGWHPAPLGIVAVLASTPCSSGAFVPLRTTGTVMVVALVDDDGGARFHPFEAVDSQPLTSTALACILTGWLSGGACWAWLAMPFDSQVRESSMQARQDVARLGPCAHLIDIEVAQIPWGIEGRHFRVLNSMHAHQPFTDNELASLCQRGPKQAPRAKTAPSPSIEPPPTFDPAG